MIWAKINRDRKDEYCFRLFLLLPIRIVRIAIYVQNLTIDNFFVTTQNKDLTNMASNELEPLQKLLGTILDRLSTIEGNLGIQVPVNTSSSAPAEGMLCSSFVLSLVSFFPAVIMLLKIFYWTTGTEIPISFFIFTIFFNL